MPERHRTQSLASFGTWKDVDCGALRHELEEEVADMDGWRGTTRNDERRVPHELAIKLATLDQRLISTRSTANPRRMRRFSAIFAA